MPLTYDNSRIVDGLMPSLDLGFSENDYRLGLKKVGFSGIVTFSRASGGGRFNAQGQYEWLSADQPRIDYDPVSGECRGILIEEQRTNLLTYSEQFDNAAAWVKVNANVIADAVIAPDGTLSGDKLVEDTGYTNHYNRQPKTVVPGTIYTFSCYLKAGERTQGSLEIYTGATVYKAVFNLVTGAFITSAGVGSYVVTPIGNGWFRFAITAVASTTTLNGFIYPASGQITNYTGDGTSGIYIWGAQLEVGAFPTSYIPTTTAQVTRAADVCSVNNLSPWYRADEGTLLVDWNLPVNTSDNNQLAAFGSVVASSMAIRMGVNNGRRVRAFAQDASGVFQYSVDCPVEASRTTGKSAFSYKSKDDFAVSSAGSIQKDISGDISDLSISTLRVGRNGGTYANGHIRRVRYIPRRISNTELQALTAI